MVGVPHSTGCARCRERRIKCDKVTPDCSQCRRYGRPCPGYQRTFRFQDEGPALERRHNTASNRSSRPSLSSSESSIPDAAETVRANAMAMIQRYATMGDDYTNISSHTRIVLDRQHTQCFVDFIRNAFPTMYYYNRFRATDRLDFPSYIIRDIGCHVFQDAAVACLSSVYLAHLSQDLTLLKTSRQLYSQALREVVRALETPDAMSDSMLCTMMMLSVYEMYAQTSKDAWVIHADGVRRLMASRGAQAHTLGLARSCYIAFRGFLVATAVYKGKPCFLDGEEWQQLAYQVGAEDSQKPTEWSTSINPAELVFIEIAKCPRYLSEALAISASYPSSTPAIPNLLQRIQCTSQNLVQLKENLRSCMGYDQRSQAESPLSSSSPGDAMGGESGPSLLLQGAENAVTLLDHLMNRLGRAGTPADDGTALSFGVVSELDRGPPIAPSNRIDFHAVTRLDRVASSMGMLGTAIVSI